MVPKLKDAGHTVIPMDIGWFGEATGDFRDIKEIDADAVIHLAAVANDPTGDLNPELTWKTNAFGTMDLAEKAVKAGVKQFIYASSGSVYGISDLDQVTEDAPCVPLSAYNETKKVAERCLLSYADKMAVQILRPATVCGLSPRMRLDVVVNMLTMQALTKGKITVLGGLQMRPHIHIEDMCDLYLWMLEHPEKTGIWNAGFENCSVLDLAKSIAGRTGSGIEIKPSNDARSYRMNSDKLYNAGFRQKRSVRMAIAEIEIAYKTGKLKDEPICYNLQRMKELGVH